MKNEKGSPLTNPTVYIDSRERQSGLVDHLHALGDFEVVERWLPYGDILVGDLLIERKTTQDLVASLQDGRLFRQMGALQAFSTRRLLLIEGIGFPLSRGVSEASINGALLKIEVGMQVPVVTTSSLNQTAALIHRIVLQESRAVTRAIREKNKRTKRETCPQVKALRAVPDLPASSSRKLLAHFGTLKAVFNADADDLSEVTGIDRECAQTVLKFATEPALLSAPV